MVLQHIFSANWALNFWTHLVNVGKDIVPWGEPILH